MNKNLSKSDLILILDIIHASLTCKNNQEFELLIRMTQTLIDFQHVRSLFGDSSNYKKEKMGALKFVTEFPKEWEIRYDEKDYFLYDNIAVTAYHKGGLIYWSDYIELKGADDTRNKKSREIMEEAGSVGLKNGWLYSMQGRRSSERAILSLAGEKCAKDERSRKILEHLSPHLSLAVKSIITEREEVPTKLTPRECEVLSWTTAGKTAWEISLLLNISRRTVEFHMGNILNKLNAVNAQQAIAIALSRGLITY
jgi:DNA-binding CsgD family transcriptional regulator